MPLRSLGWIAWLKRLVLPPAGPLLLGLAALGAPEPWRLWLMTSSLGILTLLAMPCLGLALLRRLERFPPLGDDDLEALHLEAGADAIVVLDGGRYLRSPATGAVKPETLERLRYAAQLRRRTGLPILATGDGAGALMAEVLRQDFGLETRWLETASRNTQENADLSEAILRREGRRRILLVTHSWHMPRAAKAFERRGLEVIPAPTGFAGPDRQALRLMSLVPSAMGLEASWRALHELIGLLWYAVRYR